MIEKLEINNFKSWEYANISFAKLTGFFGTNSSGKTSILQLLLLLKQTIESTDRAQTLEFGNNKTYVELGTYKDVVFNHNTSKDISFKLGWNLNGNLEIQNPEKRRNQILFKSDSMEFDCKIYQKEKSKLFVKNFKYKFDDFSFSMNQLNEEKHTYAIKAIKDTKSDKRKFRFIRNKGRKWSLPEPTKFYGFPDQVNAYFQNSGFLSDLQLEFEKLFGKVYYLGPLRDYPQRQYTWAGAKPFDMGRRGEQVIDALLSSKGKTKISRGTGKQKYTVEEYVAYWLKELGLIDNFRVEEIAKGANLYRVLVKKNQNSPEVLITDVGFGVSQILPVIALCYYVPEGSTLIIEQPEIHLHPKVQAGLADVFMDAIKVKNIQIILESHSEHLLRRLQRRMAEESFNSTDTALFFCANEKNHSRITSLNLDTFGNITNYPKGFFGDEMSEIAAMNKAMLKRKIQNEQN